MAVRIPQYTQQVGTPNSRVAGAEGRGYNPFEIDFSGLARAFEGIDAARQQSEMNNARAQLAAEEPRAQLAMSQQFAQIQQAWTPESKPIADQMFEAIDAYQADAEKRITNPKARELLLERSQQFKAHYGVQGFAYQQQKEIENRVSTYESAYQDVTNLASIDPSAFGQSIVQINAAVMADTQIPEMTKRGFVTKQAKAAALKVGEAQAKLRPKQTVDYIDALLGITEPVLKVTDGGKIADEIIRRESGGRLYDAAGNILKGKAIKTRDGKIVHAYGKYQLLETTAEATAKDLGVPWKPEVFLRGKSGDVRLDAETAEYHDLLGQAYISQQDASFGGNPVLIAAAHNMGPAATKGWAEGRPYQTQSGDWWHPKRPMDLEAMPKETRKYIEGLGVIAEEPKSKADVSGDDATAYRLLDTDSLLHVRNLAMGNLADLQRQDNEALAIQRDLFKQHVDDLEVAAKNGDTIAVPSDGELLTFLGPAQAALTKQRLIGYQGMARALKQLPGLTNDELFEMANAPDPEGTGDRENRQFVRDTIAQQATKLLAARKSDPGQSALDSSNAVRDMYAAWGVKAAEFYGAGSSATPAQFDAMAKAQADFVRTNFALQKTWGISRPKLPTVVVDKMAEGFHAQMDNDPAVAAAWIARLPDLLGSDDAVAQVGNKIGPLAWLAMDGVTGMTLARIKAAQTVPEAKRYELLPTGTSKGEVADAVRDVFDPLFATLSYQNDAATAERYRQAGMTLVTERLSREGGSVNAAAKSAYAELFGDRNAINGTYRVDTTLYDPVALGQRLDSIRDTLPGERLQVTAEPGFTLAESQERKARAVRRSSYWINNESGKGVYLMHPNGSVIDRNGKPIEVLFDDAMKQNLPAPPPGLGGSFRAAKGF